MSQSITAAGEWTRANSDAYARYAEGNLYYARARKELADAVELELENYLKVAEIYYDRRIERERSKLELAELSEERKDKYLEYRKNARERLLKSILSDRERSMASIQSGVSLNKVLNALADTPVVYGIDLGPSLQREVDSRMTLTSADLKGIYIKAAGSQKQTMPLLQRTGMSLPWWPDHLRQPEFEPLRDRLTSAIERINQFAGGEVQIDFDALSELRLAFAALSQKYMSLYPPSRKRTLSTAEMMQYIRTQDFLAQLFQDIQRMRDTGKVEVVGESQPFDVSEHGADAATLATWMLRNGVSFAKPPPGHESTYSRMFTKFADLYELVGTH